MHWFTELMVSLITARSPGPLAPKPVQTLYPSTTVFDSWYDMFVLIGLVLCNWTVTCFHMLYMLTEACRIYSSWVFADCVSIARSGLGVNLLGHPLLGRLAILYKDGLQIVWKWPFNPSQIDGQQRFFCFAFLRSPLMSFIFGIVLTHS